MTAGTQTDSDFAFAGLATPEAEATEAIKALAAGPDPLGALAGLLGTWKGHGFNAIWRPHNPASQQDRFLELNKTDETLVFTRINGPIPNRGLAMADIDMFGLTYMQQISETSTGAGLHIEPGIWASVPATTDPSEPASVVRMASIPHGTTIMAQGGAPQVISGGPQTIPNNNILPFFFNTTPPANGDFNTVAETFTELNLSQSTQFRSVAPGVTQAIVQNPNSVLQAALKSSLQGTTMKSRTFLHVASDHTSINAGGGTANTAFLSSSTNPSGGNALATTVQATFWIETIAGTGGQPDKHQLQYTQLVMLDFNGIHWPHVTVGTLVKQ
jgi:hypothetical protein